MHIQRTHPKTSRHPTASDKVYQASAVFRFQGNSLQLELGVVLHLFLSVEGHGVVGDHARMVYKVAGLHKHTAAAASRVQQNAVGRLQHIDDHLHQRFRRKEHAVVLCHILGKLKLNGKPDDSADTYENLELLSKVTERNFSSAATSKIQTADPLSENRPFISSGKRSTELQTIRELGEKMATVDHVADAEGMFSEINSASDSFIFRLEQCFALYPDFLTNVEIEAKVIAALQKAESYIVHLKEQHRQHLLKTTNSQ